MGFLNVKNERCIGVRNQFFKTLIELIKKWGIKKLGVETPPRRRIDRGHKETIDSINFHFFHTSSRSFLKTLKDHR
jgi:hypothetical protein